jgi:hypothetical protein
VQACSLQSIIQSLNTDMSLLLEESASPSQATPTLLPLSLQRRRPAETDGVTVEDDARLPLPRCSAAVQVPPLGSGIPA